jgi:hypothetical protein
MAAKTASGRLRAARMFDVSLIAPRAISLKSVKV